MSKDEHGREGERWFMSTLPAVKIRLLNEENKQMVASVNVPSPVDSDSRDPPPVRDKERKKPKIKGRYSSSGRPYDRVGLHLRGCVWFSKVC